MKEQIKFTQTRLMWLRFQRPDYYIIGDEGLIIVKTHFLSKKFDTRISVSYKHMSKETSWSYMGVLMWLFGKGYGPIVIKSGEDIYKLKSVRKHEQMGNLLDKLITKGSII